MIINVFMMLLLLVQQKYEYLPFLSIVLGVLVVDLYFNIPPARFWNGGRSGDKKRSTDVYVVKYFERKHQLYSDEYLFASK